MDKSIQNKIDEVHRILKNKKVLVAYSGGVDSSTISSLAKDVCDRVLAVTVYSQLMTENELENAKETAKKLGIEWKVVEIDVLSNNSTVENLNELEYVQGRIYANIWREEKIAIINPRTGEVEAWIDMRGIQNMENRDSEDVLNGIAYDAQNNRLFVTGKHWSHLYEIELIPLGDGGS